MQLGVIGMGRMGAGISRRLMKDGHSCVVFDQDAGAVAKVSADGATGAKDLAGLVKALLPPRVQVRRFGGFRAIFTQLLQR